ncbi:MAG: hypothetical protein U1E51_24645 [Candidatus Binatia bacterium]|nr:hypothetical protein [Candidatus Binatia bacterium]
MSRRWIILVVVAVALLAVVLLWGKGPPAEPQSTGVFQIPPTGEQVTVNGIVAGTGRSEDGVFAFYVERSAEKDAVAIRTSCDTMLYAGKFAPRRFIEGDVVEGDSVEVEAVSDGTRLTALGVKRFRDADE